MNCPLLMINNPPHRGPITPYTTVGDVEATECLGESCAWWIKEAGVCCIAEPAKSRAEWREYFSKEFDK